MYGIGSISSRNTDTDRKHRQFYVLSVKFFFFVNIVSIHMPFICQTKLHPYNIFITMFNQEPKKKTIQIDKV